MSDPLKNDYEFTLVLRGIREITEEVENGLFEAGCDDATLSMELGVCILEFCRNAPSLVEAITSAIKNVYESKLDLSVVQVDECNLVTQAEIARRCDRSRSIVSMWIEGKRGQGGFPPPVCHISDHKPLWRWCDVSAWLSDNNIIAEKRSIDAQVIATINNELERKSIQRRNPDLSKKIDAFFDTECEACS